MRAAYHTARFCQVVATRAQAVSVKGGANEAAICEGHQRRAIPWLHDCAVEPVEVTLVLHARIQARQRLTLPTVSPGASMHFDTMRLNTSISK